MYEVALLLNTIIFAAVLVVYLRQACASIFHPMTWYLIFHSIVFVIRPLFADWYKFNNIYDAVGFYPTTSDKLTVLVGVNVALLVFGYTVLHVGRMPVRFANTGIDAQKVAVRPWFWPAAAILAPLAIWALVYLWGQDDSVSVMDARTGVSQITQSNGYFISAPLMLAPLTVICAWFYRFKPLAWLPFLVFFVLQMGTGGRGNAVVPAVMICLLFMFDKKRYWPNMRVCIGGALLLTVFNAVVADRGAAIRSMFSENVAKEVYVPEGLKPFEHMDFANLEFFEFLVYAVPQRTGSYDYFVNNLQLLTEPIPRTLWPGKPQGQPIRFFYLGDYGRQIGMTLSMPGAGWLSWGYPGIVIWAALFGFIYGGAYRAYARGRQGLFSTIFYITFLASSVIAFRDGLVLTIAKQLLFYFFPTVAVYLSYRLFFDNSRSSAGTLLGKSGASLPLSGPRERRHARARLLERQA